MKIEAPGLEETIVSHGENKVSLFTVFTSPGPPTTLLLFLSFLDPCSIIRKDKS